jgi:lipoprotein-anchoring transpeptidase ErfK/SrfK
MAQRRLGARPPPEIFLFAADRHGGKIVRAGPLRNAKYRIGQTSGGAFPAQPRYPFMKNMIQHRKIAAAVASIAVSVALTAFGQSQPQAAGSTLQPDAINSAVYEDGPLPPDQSALTAHLQILLDRSGISPGVIDGFDGENVEKALRAFEEVNGFPVDGQIDMQVWEALRALGGDVIVSRTITEEDVADIVDPLPEDYAELAELETLGYTSAAEKLAERFHMDIDFLQALNPDSDFSAPGTEIHVADTGSDAESAVARLVADKSMSRLLAYDVDDRLVLGYPVTIGSDDTPSPSGEHQVRTVAMMPTYTYNPGKNFQQGDNDKPLTIPPGPNGPVGSVWIDLSEPTYGIHGTPEPSKIGKTSSHGCVRMTNWDASELAHLVSDGVPVSFQD